MLIDMGVIRIEKAMNGELAIKAIRSKYEQDRESFDLVLLDLSMPVMDGH